ncbi:ABC transporter ATP-binding protein [Variovorax atrisoli]|uniref:ABC transporter ATP-binding protein n=1 Tax=Variovorax atrisoli TaxID=3394203 RepID=UPI004040250D
MSEARPAQAVLEARDLSFGYARGRDAVFEKVSLEVAPREIVCLLGGSGCGKSTLLRTLAHLEAPAAGRASGQIRFLGEPLAAPHPRAAMVFQQPGLLPWLDAARNVGFGLGFARQPRLERARREQRVQDALAAVGLAGQGGLYPSQLSGGMAQRVALARALAREPVLLLADEPFSALDAITRAEMQDLLVELVHRWQTAALLVTHDIDEAILVADRILLMGGAPGRIVREWRVPAQRPRTADAAAFTALRLDILAALHTARAAGTAPAAPVSSPESLPHD